MYNNLDDDLLTSNLKKLRKLNGLTQKQVEETIGLGANSIVNIETGRSQLSIKIAVDLANLFKCNLDDLLKINKNSQVHNSPKIFFPLVCTGLLGKDHYLIHHSLMSDPVIMAELNLNSIKIRRSPIDSITSNLTKAQKRGYYVELLKYVNSLIGIDKKILFEEIAIRDSIQAGLNFELTQREENSISRSLHKEYFGKSIDRLFPNKAVKRLLLWILLLVAVSDDDYDLLEKKYIFEVSKHIGLRNQDFNYIEGVILEKHYSVDEATHQFN